MDLTGVTADGRYRLVRQTAEGRTSSLYRAEDLKNNGAQRVVKILKHDPTSRRIEDIIRFKSEAAVVAKLSHPNIVPVFGTGEIMGRLYIAMDYIEGPTLAEEIASGPLPLDRALRIIAEIAEALIPVHEQGIIHRDLKPGNIILCEGRAMLIDFGIARVKEYSIDGGKDQIPETLGYISPEQTGVLKRGTDERSDLYSIGIILYELLTATLPFTGDDIASIIHKHVAVVPPPPGEALPGLPAIVDTVVMKLLEKDPELRYQSAQGLLRDIQRIKKGEYNFIPGLEDKSFRLSFRTLLVGREKELARLKEIITASRGNTGKFCLISGEAGRGKTRLVEELRDYIYSGGGILIDGKCTDQKRKTPYSPIKDALERYHHFFATATGEKKKLITNAIKKEFGDLFGVIISLCPLMGEIYTPGSRPLSLKAEREHERFLMVIRKFFTLLSHVEQGLVIMIGDLHWADEGTLEILNELSEAVREGPLVVIGTFRDDAITAEGSLISMSRRLSAAGHPPVQIHLANFNELEMARFVAALLREKEEEVKGIAGFIMTRSRGNPFFAIDLLKQLIDEQAIYFDRGGWRINSEALQGLEVSESVVDLLLRRIDFLGEKEKNILSYAAVIGKSFDITILFSLSDLPDDEVVRIVDRAIALGILEGDSTRRGMIHFVHDRIKEAFYQSMGEKERGAFHRATGAALEGAYRDRVSEVIFDLAYHFIEGGDRERALQYSYPAGIRAKENYAYDEALYYFNITLEILDTGIEIKDPKIHTLWKSTLAVIGEIYVTIGDYDKGIAIYEKLTPFAGLPPEQVYINEQLSQIYFKKGNWHLCEEYARRGLGIMGEKLPSGRFSLIFRIAKEALVRALHTVFPFIFVRKSEKQGSDRWKNIARFIITLGWNFILSDVLKYVHSILRGLNISESKIGPSGETAMMMSGYASILSAIPLFNYSMKYHHLALAMRERINNPWGTAQTLQLLGFTLNWKGDYHKSIQALKRAIDIFEKIGDIRETGMTYAGLIHNYSLLSDYTNLETALERYRSITQKSDDMYGISESLTYSAAYFRERGDIEKALQYATQAYRESLNKEILFTACRACIELGKIYCEKGEIDLSLEFLKEAVERYESKNFLKNYTIYLYTYHAEAAIERFTRRAFENGEGSRKELHAIKRLCRTAVKKSRRWISHRGIALFAMGRYKTLAGNEPAAARLFIRGIELCRGLGQQFNTAVGLYEYGMFLSHTGKSERAKKNLEEAYTIFSAIGAHGYTGKLEKLLGIDKRKSTGSPIKRVIDRERRESLDKITSEIAAISDTGKMLNRLLARSIELTGAQRGCLFILNKEHIPEMAASISYSRRGSFRFSNSIIQQTLKEEKYIITTDVSEDIDYLKYRSVVLHDLKSIICLPIKAREKVIGLLYLDNPLTGAIFTENEAEILSSFLSRTALAIENTFLHEQLKKIPKKKEADISNVSIEKLKEAIKYIDENYSDTLSREGLASLIDVHPDYFGRIFKQHTGKRINEYINELRIAEAITRLTDTDDTIVEISFSIGFESLRTFNRAFLKTTGETPSQYRGKNREKAGK